MEEPVAVFSTQAEMPVANPVERNDAKDGPASERANSKPVAARKDVAIPKGRAKIQKSVKEITKSGKKASNSSAAKRTVDKTTKPSESGAKKAAKTVKSVKSPIKKKAAVSKVKIPKKSMKKESVKKTSAKTKMISAKASKK